MNNTPNSDLFAWVVTFGVTLSFALPFWAAYYVSKLKGWLR